MDDIGTNFSIGFLDYFIFCGYFIVLSVIGFFAGRAKKDNSEEYFLAGRSLPWYVVGTSFIASNISSEHFIGMIAVALIYGICGGIAEWGTVFTYAFIIWFFIPFLLASKAFTIPEFLEKRFNSSMRLIFATVTIVVNITAFLASVLYGGGVILSQLFDWDLWVSIVVIGTFSGIWSVYGGLRSVAWTDFFTVIVMVAGGLLVTIFGLLHLSGDSQSIVEGFSIMLDRNQATTGVWKEAVDHNIGVFTQEDQYNRLSVLQPITHQVSPWLGSIFGFLGVGIWYFVLNQFMIQRVLGAKNTYHAKMGIVLAGYLKAVLPVIVVIPGLILFALNPEILLLPDEEMRLEADKGYIYLIELLIPVGLKGLLIAALFGAIQSTVNSVVNSTATVFTLDIWQRYIMPDLHQKQIVKIGMWVSVVILVIAMVMGRYIAFFGDGLFIYIATMYAFFAPPFAAVFLLGLFSKRINGTAALLTIAIGFVTGIGMKVAVSMFPDTLAWLSPYNNQGFINWAICFVCCWTLSWFTPGSPADKLSEDLVINWSKLDFFAESGEKWYTHVFFWWLLFLCIILGIFFYFSDATF